MLDLDGKRNVRQRPVAGAAFTNMIMLFYRPLAIRRWSAVTALTLAMLSSPITAQSLAPDAAVEDIVILRSLRLSRVTPTDFCGPSRTGFSEAAAEDRYDFKAVATDAASGKVTNANGARVGTLHACFSPTSDPLISSFYAEGEVGGVSLVGRGQCRTTQRDFPEAGITLFTCQLDLTGLPSAYVGGQTHHEHARIAHHAGSGDGPTGLHAAVYRHGPSVEETIVAPRCGSRFCCDPAGGDCWPFTNGRSASQSSR
jgi:hypothetical protein